MRVARVRELTADTQRSSPSRNIETGGMSVLCDISLKSELLYFADDGFQSARERRGQVKECGGGECLTKGFEPSFSFRCQIALSQWVFNRSLGSQRSVSHPQSVFWLTPNFTAASRCRTPAKIRFFLRCWPKVVGSLTLAAIVRSNDKLSGRVWTILS